LPLRDVQLAYCTGRQPGLVLGNVAAYAYYEYAADGLNVARLQRALDRIVARHAALRTIILPEGRQQVVHEASIAIRAHDLQRESADVVDAHLRDTRGRLSHQVLPLDQLPLLVMEVSLLPHERARLHVGIDLAIGDAWSYRLLLRELAQLYGDPERELPALESSFGDYLIAEVRERDTPAYANAREYWAARLSLLPPAPPLPTAVDLEHITQPRFARISGELPADQWQALKARCVAAAVTPTVAVLAIYATVLARHSGASRFTLNMPIFSRPPLVPGVEAVLGDFTVLLPLALEDRLGGSFLDYCRRIQQQLWDDMDHRAASGWALRERVRRSGDYRDGLLPVVFTSLLGFPIDTTGTGDWPVHPVPTFTIGQTPQVALDLIVLEGDGALRYAWHDVEGLFPPELLAGLVMSFSRELQSVLDAKAWTRTDEPAPAGLQAAAAPAIAGTRLEGLFLAQVQDHADRPAVITARENISYGELERRTGALADRLRRTGAGPGTIVGVLIEKGWEQVVAVLAILRAGAAYLPIEPKLPPERRRQILAQAQARMALTHAVPADNPMLPLDRIDMVSIIADAGPAAPAVNGSDALAYVIFTSGSTGIPKGVMISHRGAVNTILAVNRMCSLGPDDRVLAVSSLAFDLSVYDIFGPLAVGGAIVMPDVAHASNAHHWLDLMTHMSVTIWNSVPALLELLLDVTRDDDDRISRLRGVMLSGDWVPLNLVPRLRRAAPHASLLAMGGATEASIWSIHKWVTAVEPQWRSVPYGRPLPNQQVHVLDPRLRVCPAWTTGELYIGGVGVALGYIGDPECTSASFITHPVTGERLYRTGDLGRYLPDGDIEFLGRRDGQVKVFGHRIELGDIEAAALQFPGVHKCVATALGDERRRRCLAAYIVSAPGAEVGESQLREFLAARLPGYMVPRYLVPIDAVPLTANGKVDVTRLPSPLGESSEAPSGYVAPRNDAEAALAAFWAEVLQREQVSVDDDFFELGGDSLAATRILARVSDRFGCEKTVSAVFDDSTIARFCAVHLAGANVPLEDAVS
jgi:amino acid adenylation domain-containing protein